ncbi:MAG TPA: phage holin family protein [Steroidobacteraceae bacterium]|nr:phage holin family protein [Steroidobacteraceae bacterium]
MRESQADESMSEADALPPGMASAAHGGGFAEEASSARAPGLIRGLLAAILDSIKTRLDLAAVEAEIYLVYVAQLLLWGFAAVCCALLAVVFALTAIVIAVWQTHRMAGLVGSMVVLLLLAVSCGLVGARIFRGRPPLLAGTIGQFEHDQRRMAGAEGDR